MARHPFTSTSSGLTHVLWVFDSFKTQSSNTHQDDDFLQSQDKFHFYLNIYSFERLEITSAHIYHQTDHHGHTTLKELWILKSEI